MVVFKSQSKVILALNQARIMLEDAAVTSVMVSSFRHAGVRGSDTTQGCILDVGRQPALGVSSCLNA